MSDEPPTSAAVALLRDFVNTREPQLAAERLGSPDALRDWLVEHGLLPAGASLSAADLATAVSLREGLREVLLAHAGHGHDPVAVERLNRLLVDQPARLVFGEDGGYHLVSGHDSPFGQAVGRLVDAVRDASEDGSWSRLKVCARDTCRWAFYDASRNRVRRWCSMTTCGNQTKMKRAYARRTGTSGRLAGGQLSVPTSEANATTLSR